jgi:Na+/H+ antiporter NhaD/arsenite permease-like protein
MEKNIILGLFLLTYVLLLSFPKWRAYVALITAGLFISFSFIPFFDLDVLSLLSGINLNVIFMITGTMVVVSYFIESHAPEYLADELVKRITSVKWAIIALALFSGLISAFIDNVATVLIVAPIALSIAKRAKVSPVPFIIAITVSANLQGFATLVGDTTSILLAELAGMNFLDFFINDGNIGPFFIVQLGALSTVVVMLVIFRQYNLPLNLKPHVTVSNFMPSLLLLAIIGLLIGASFIDDKHPLTNGFIAIGVALFAIVYDFFKNRSLKRVMETITTIDLNTLLLLAGLFVIIQTLTDIELINDLANLLVSLGQGNEFLLFTLTVWLSVLFSAFIDNIPYVATLLPVMSILAANLGMDPFLLYFGLLSGATLGGNLTPIGASANIAGLGLLRKEGIEVSFKDFAKIAWPMTLVAVTVAYIVIWVFYG